MQTSAKFPKFTKYRSSAVGFHSAQITAGVVRPNKMLLPRNRSDIIDRGCGLEGMVLMRRGIRPISALESRRSSTSIRGSRACLYHSMLFTLVPRTADGGRPLEEMIIEAASSEPKSSSRSLWRPIFFG